METYKDRIKSFCDAIRWWLVFPAALLSFGVIMSTIDAGRMMYTTIFFATCMSILTGAVIAPNRLLATRILSGIAAFIAFWASICCIDELDFAGCCLIFITSILGITTAYSTVYLWLRDKTQRIRQKARV